MAILRHVSKHDEILQSHLYNTEPNSRIKYTSPDIKIIKISGEIVGELVMTKIFTDSFACTHRTKKFLTKYDFTASTFNKPYTHGDLFMCSFS
jgi:hypothetical protein